MLGMLGALARVPDLIMAEQDPLGDGGTVAVELLRNEFNFEVPALLIGNAGPAGAPVEARGGLPALYWPCNAGRLRTLINNVLHARAPAEPVQARRAG
jgi:hypothetical protein